MGLGQSGSGVGGSAEAQALGISTVLACVKALYDDQTCCRSGRTPASGTARASRRVQPRIILEPFGPDLDPAAGRRPARRLDRDARQRLRRGVSRDPDTRCPTSCSSCTRTR
jgi:hypothetical protein